MSGNVQIRVSVINVPGELSPLKLRGWLLQQAREIEAMSSEHCYTQVKLFLSKRQRFAFPQKKLDALLQGIVDKFPAIHGIALCEVEQSLDAGQMQDAMALAEQELQTLSRSFEDFMAKEQAGAPPH
jgi:hypothetical protein